MAERLGKRFPPTPGIDQAVKSVIAAFDAAERRRIQRAKETEVQGLEIVGKVESLALGPGDVVVIKVDQIINSDMAKLLEEKIGEYFPDNRVLALGRDIDLFVARKAEGEKNA